MLTNSVIDTETACSVVSTIPTTPDRGRSPGLDDSLDELENDSCDIKTVPRVEKQNGRATPRPVHNMCFVGAGYVGGPTAALIAFKNPNIQVTVVDKDDRRIRRWNSRHLPIYEPGLGEIVRVARDGLQPKEPVTTAPTSIDDSKREARDNATVPRKPNLVFSTDVSRCIGEADIVVIAVNTPTKQRGAGKGSATDMTSFEAVAMEVVRHAKKDAIVVEKSTVPCRTAAMIQEMVWARHDLITTCRALYFETNCNADQNPEARGRI